MGHKKVGGRKAGTPDIPCLRDAVAVYNKRGGIKYLEAWVDESAYNKRRFMETILAIALKQVAEKQEHSGEVKASIAFIMPRPVAKPEEPK